MAAILTALDMASERKAPGISISDASLKAVRAGQNPAVTGYDSALWVDQHGVREAKFPDTAGDFGHLSRRMRPRIPRVRDKILYLSILNSERFNSLSGCRRGSYARARKGVTLIEGGRLHRLND